MKRLSNLILLFFIISTVFSNSLEAFSTLENKADQIGDNVTLGNNNDGSVLDIMILYTPAASQDLGGQINAEKWIENAVLHTNTAMRNSKVNLRFDLCHKRQISYNESTNSVDLKNLTNGENGLESVADLRKQYHADIVVLITFNMEGGQAQALMSLTGEQLKSRFAVIKAGSTSTFVHEVGHILGAQHDGINDKGVQETGVFPYAHGYTGNNLTASSIVGGYVSSNMTSGKINVYSNPNLTYRNGPIGTSSFSDNHRTFNETAAAIDQLFNSESTWTGNSNSDWYNPANWSMNIVPRPFDDVVIPAGLTNFPSIQSGTATCRNLFIRKGSTLNILAGRLNVRGHLKSEGNLLATGGTVDMRCELDNGAAVSLSSSSYFHDLVIGGSGARSWIQLKSRLIVKGDLTIDPWAVLDPMSHSIAVNGNWTDEGGAGFDYQNNKVKISGTTSIKNTSYNFIIPPDPKGGQSYISETPGWGKGTEGNFNLEWMFGGQNGQAWLKGTFASNDPIGYVIDSWIFTPPVALSPNTKYLVEFEANASKQGQGMQRGDNGKYELHDLSVHYGNGQLPSLMNAVGTVQQVTSDNVWVNIKNEISVSSNGKYELGLRTFNNRDAWGADTFIKNIKITPISEKPESFGKAIVDVVTTDPTTSDPGTTSPTNTDPINPNKPVVNPATTTNPTTETNPTTTTDPNPTTDPAPPAPVVITYPLLIATGNVYNVNNSINWRTYTYNVDLDRIEASYYAPRKDDGVFTAGNEYPIFMITHANRSQGFLHYIPANENWANEIKSFRSGTVTPRIPGPNSFKPKDTFKLFYEPGKLTWEVSRADEIVAVFSAPYTAEKVSPGVLDNIEGEKEETEEEEQEEESEAAENSNETDSSTNPNTSAETEANPKPINSINSVKKGQELIMNDKMYSSNGKYYLILQSDGNVVIYTKANQLVWETQTGGNGKHCRFAMQTDGNLVLYNQSGQAIWASETHSYWDPKYSTSVWEPVKMVLENDGALVLYSSTNNKVWTSKSGKLPNTD